jgi:hypothetical protein
MNSQSFARPHAPSEVPHPYCIGKRGFSQGKTPGPESLRADSGGRNVVVFVNGWKVIDTDFGYLNEPVGKFKAPFADLPLDGYVMLQDHGGEVWFRNIYVRRAAGTGS